MNEKDWKQEIKKTKRFGWVRLELAEGNTDNGIDALLKLAEEHFNGRPLLDEISRLKAALAKQAQENEKLNQSVGWHSEQKTELEGKLENATSQVLIESNKRQAMSERIDKTIQRLLDNPPKRVGVSVIQANGWMGFAVSLREELKKGGEQND